MPVNTAKLTALLYLCIAICLSDNWIRKTNAKCKKSVTFSQFLIHFWIILIIGRSVVSCAVLIGNKFLK